MESEQPAADSGGRPVLSADSVHGGLGRSRPQKEARADSARGKRTIRQRLLLRRPAGEPVLPDFEEGFIRDKNVSANELCEYTLNYIRENYAQPLSIPRICTDVGISQTYLSRLLRKYAGTTFNTFLTQCRMDAAKQMLRDHPDILLHEVAACVGYDDQSYFSKIFRNETGMTPSQYAATFAADAPNQPPKA